ncbi:hypothetical protein HED60_11130 [Planctomycetales bacterium ZRK34]|nr:hypothetical protein HED60_11130 [Planctomycetales bacterium ZRK34]
MLWIALILMLGAAAGGLAMLTLVLSGKHVPLILAFGHAAVALSGIGVIIADIARSELQPLYAWAALACFTLGAMGGSYLLSNHMRGRKSSHLLRAAHITAIGAGLIMLIMGVIKESWA